MGVNGWGGEGRASRGGEERKTCGREEGVAEGGHCKQGT